MKQSMIIGVVMLYIIMMGLQMFVTDVSATSETGIGSELHNYRYPSEVTAYTNPDTGQSAATIGAGTIASSLWDVGQMAMLRFPALFTDNYVWFWYIFCLPISISFWAVMFMIFRGVTST